MDVNAVAAMATAMKVVETQGQAGTAVAKKVIDMVRAEGDMVLQLMATSMGIGQNIDILA